MVPNDAMATQDIDLLFDTRKRVPFLPRMECMDVSLLDVLKKAGEDLLQAKIVDELVLGYLKHRN
jgi:Nucleotidyltransferase